MSIINLAKYFFYIATRWNPRIAVHIIRNEIRGEKKYNIETTGVDELDHLEKKGIDTSHATMYMPASYDLLEEAFARVQISHKQHFIDIGCGMGRALCVAASNGAKKVTGIDFSSLMTKGAKRNLEICQKKYGRFEAAVLNNDAFYYEIPADGDCIFFFNPFDEVIMSGVAENIFQSGEDHPRVITVIYINPLHKQIFLDFGFEEIHYSKKLRYLEVSILEKKF